MERGQRLSKKQIETMRAYLATGCSVSETARKMSLAKSTVSGWKKQFETEGVRKKDEQGRTQKGAGARVGDERTADEQRTPDEREAAEESEGSDTPATFEELRAFNQERFIRDAGEIVREAQSLIKYNLEKAVEQRKKIDEVIELLAERGKVLTDKELRRVLLMLLELKAPDIGKLSSVMGTMYDKRALARGEPTENLGGTIKFEDL